MTSAQSLSAYVQLSLLATPVRLLAQRVVWLPQQRSVLIADAHLGKAASFRSLGVPVPHGTTVANLSQIRALLQQYQPRHVLFLGDLLHARAARTHAVLDGLSELTAAFTQTQFVLIRGNHDDAAGDPPASSGIHIVNEPYTDHVALGTLAACHHPQLVPGYYSLAGHIHPVVRVGNAVQRLRAPCFWLGDEDMRPQGVLPAFGEFTGGHVIEPFPQDRIFAVAANEAVIAVPVTRSDSFASFVRN